MLDVAHAYFDSKAIPLLLAASGLLWALMFFGPLAHLERLASGLTPFDIRRGATVTRSTCSSLDMRALLRDKECPQSTTTQIVLI